MCTVTSVVDEMDEEEGCKRELERGLRERRTMATLIYVHVHLGDLFHMVDRLIWIYRLIPKYLYYVSRKSFELMYIGCVTILV